MKTRQLGQKGLSTSAIGLGCMGFSQGYGHADDEVSLQVMRSSLEAGVTLFDTAISYGQGHNERLLARFLADPGPNRADIRVATKAGIVRGDDGVSLDGRPDHIAGYCDTSLERLGIETIDLYYLHRVDPKIPIAETVGAMAQLVEAGKVRHLGLSEVTPTQLEIATAVHPIAAVQFEWSIMWREPETSIVPAARRLGVGLVPYSPLGRGFLSATLDTDDKVHSSQFRQSDPRFNGEALIRNRHQLGALERLAKARDLTTAQLSLAWLLAQGDDVVPIPGTRRLDRAQENAAAAEIDLSASELRRIEEAVPPDHWAGDRKSFAVPTIKRVAPEGLAE